MRLHQGCCKAESVATRPMWNGRATEQVQELAVLIRLKAAGEQVEVVEREKLLPPGRLEQCVEPDLIIARRICGDDRIASEELVHPLTDIFDRYALLPRGLEWDAVDGCSSG